MTALALALVACCAMVCGAALVAYRWTLDGARWAMERHHTPPQVAALHALKAEVDTLRASLALRSM